ncbi:MAG: MATE family efflux transporter [Lachnospiraceae bacterium]|nr:MATE family efflux transporter [Lachnospiraceae bacterium]
MKITDDLTRGNIRNQLLVLALPLILGNIFQQFYNTIDSFVIGRYIGHTAFAAVGVAGTIMNLFIFVINGGCNGISIIFAELYGERKWNTLRKESFLSFSFGCFVSVGLSIIGLLTLAPLLNMIHTPAEVRVFAQDYLQMIYLGLPATFLYNWCSSVLRAAGDTKTPLCILVIAMILNFSLDYLFIICFETGISGTAAATVISQLFASIVCLMYMKIKYSCLLFGRQDMAFDYRLLLRTVNFGVVSALHQSSLYIGKLFVQGAVNTAGTEIISAYTVTMRIEGFANSFGDSGSTAISVFVAQNRGAGKNERVKQGFRKGTKMMMFLSLCLSSIMVFATPGAIILLMGKASDGLTENVEIYMKVIAIFYILCFIGNSFVGLYRGLGMVHIPVLGTALHISIRVIFSYLLIDKIGLAAVAVATGMGWIAVVIFQSILYKRGQVTDNDTCYS